jgi:type IV pilus assembly protein PilV
MNIHKYPARRTFSFNKASAGFTLLEVMIAILILAFGLLGFALLQTMSVRFTQSANYRTKATNLAADMLDQMRSNRLLAAQYAVNGSFAGSATGTNCSQPVSDVAIAQAAAHWQCQVRNGLGEGSSAAVTFVNGVATVTIRWGDQRWEGNATRTQGAYETGVVTLSSRL